MNLNEPSLVKLPLNNEMRNIILELNFRVAVISIFVTTNESLSEKKLYILNSTYNFCALRNLQLLS